MVTPAMRRADLLERAAPALIWVAVLTVLGSTESTAFSHLSPTEMETLETSRHETAVLIGVVAFFAAFLSPLLAWMIYRPLRARSVRVRRVSTIVAIVITLFGPVLPGVIGWPAPMVRLLIVLLAFAVTYWGLATSVRWAARRLRHELSGLAPMLSRVLPLLMLTVLFFFYNAEIWQVAAKSDASRISVVVAILALLCTLLAIANVREELRHEVQHHEHTTDGAAPLTAAERGNLLAMGVLITLIQSCLLGILMFVFFMVFGAVSLPLATIEQWTGSPVDRLGGILSDWAVTPSLIKVCVVLAAFSALSFTASSGTDATYRERFVSPTLRNVREALLIRHAYRTDAGSAGLS
ncbi:hypothetical protein [Demetria terragena]|uniref:hypothetical protein n=1 Tax=Demetria terragena TaxID=63959 RepID=UPI00036C6781|nr:hypothetical protein [Demetria terragena]